MQTSCCISTTNGTFGTNAGYYGNSQNQTFNESSNSGRDYLSEVCRDWEAAAKQAKTKRVVIVRTGIVLAKEGGALAKMLPIFNIFAGGPLGNGQQWCSWVHRYSPSTFSDCARLFRRTLAAKLLQILQCLCTPLICPVAWSSVCVMFLFT